MNIRLVLLTPTQMMGPGDEQFDHSDAQAQRERVFMEGLGALAAKVYPDAKIVVDDLTDATSDPETWRNNRLFSNNW